nr:hypothetical protein [Thauera phenolivorans]
MSRIARLSAALIVSAAAAAPALAAPETHQLDPTHTVPCFSYSLFGMSTQLSKFTKTTGTVTLDKLAIHQDARVHAGRFDGDEAQRFALPAERSAHVRVARGALEVNGQRRRRRRL